MKKSLFLLFSLFMLSLTLPAQVVITGDVEDGELRQKMVYATAAILQKDGRVMKGTMTDSLGRYRLEVPTAGDYRVRLSSIGYKTQILPVTFDEGQDTVRLATVVLEQDASTLATAVVTATAARVEQVGDTTQFSASAYRTPEGATLEALVKQLPGVEVSDDGTIKWNGKTVTEFLVNGKDFFKGDTKVAMKNLPTDLVSKIKAYDKKSDYTEQTGIEDGEETTVLDIMTKRELNQSWVTNVDVAYGNHHRYSGRVFATRFTDQSRITVFGSANNTGDRGFGGPRGFGGQSGLTASKMAGLDGTWDNGKKKREGGRFEIGGSASYNHTGNDLISLSNSETFLTSGSSRSFSNARSQSGSHSTSVRANMRLQWNPDSLTFINLRPQFTHSDSHNSGDSYTATFNDAPYALDGVVDPLAQDSLDALKAITVNRNRRETLGNSVSNSFGVNLNIIRRFGSNGRNLSLRGQYNYTHSHSNAYSISNITYYNGTSPSFLNQYTYTPSKSWNAGVRLGYVEPLGKNWFAELRYDYSYRYQDSDRSLYELDSIKTGSWGDPANYPPIGTLPTEADILQSVRDDFNSQYATYRYSNNNVNVGVRYTTEAIRFSAGVSFNPQHTKMEYNRPGQSIDTIITRNVFNVSPDIRFRYRFSRTDQVELRYRGSASQPSMTQLLDVVDDSDPLNISMGNPGLKPSWNNSFRAEYRAYNAERQAGMNANLSFSSTSNSISTRIVYDDATGVRYSRPENISGIWNANGRFMYNFGFGPEKLFTLTTNTSLGFSRDVGYVSRTGTAAFTRQLLRSFANPYALRSEHNSDYYSAVFDAASTQKNVSKTWNVGESLNLNYRSTYFDVGVLGTLNFQSARNSVSTASNLDTWHFSYGLSGNATLPWGSTSLSTDIRMSSRRGYSNSAMNTNEVLWNAQVSQSFLKGNALTVSVQFYDILHQQSNISRVINAQLRRDTETNAINSYFMVHVIYKLNIFAGKSNMSRDGDRDGEGPRGGRDGDGPRGGMGGPGGGMGGPGGGMGGPGGGRF